VARAGKLGNADGQQISHELRTPIAGAINTAELLLADDGLGEEQRKLAENIHRSANALLTHANDVLDFSKTGPGTIDIEEIQFSLPAVIRDVFHLLSPAAESKELALDFHIVTELERDFKLMGDPGRLRQVLTSLLTHSIESTSRGYVKLLALKEDETLKRTTVKFVVEDSGRMIEGGVEGDTSMELTSDHTGRGLSISKTVVERMKGRITLVSSHGVGTTVTLWIPFRKPPCSQATVSTQSRSSLHTSPSEPGSSSTNPETTLEGGSRSSWRKSSSSKLLAMIKPGDELPFTERGNILVLVAEDNPINQQFALASIRKLGFQAEAVWNGEEALDRIGAAMTGCQPKPAVILMDKQMPEINGYRCTHILRRHYPYRDFICDVPIVALTASAIEGDKEKCKKVGMDDYMSKPATMSTLERVIARWVTCGRTAIPFLSPGVPRFFDAETKFQFMERGVYRYTDCNEPEADCSAPEEGWNVPEADRDAPETNDSATAEPVGDEEAPSASDADEYVAASEGGAVPLDSASTVTTESLSAFGDGALLAATSTASDLAASETEQSPPPSDAEAPLAASDPGDSEYDWASFTPMCVLS
jgi:CheY-like chemotaxis protein